MKANESIAILVDTVICGNKIKGNKYYENLLKKITKSDIIWYSNDLCDKKFNKSLTKIKMIEHIAKG